MRIDNLLFQRGDDTRDAQTPDSLSPVSIHRYNWTPMPPTAKSPQRPPSSPPLPVLFFSCPTGPTSHATYTTALGLQLQYHPSAGAASAPMPPAGRRCLQLLATPSRQHHAARHLPACLPALRMLHRHWHPRLKLRAPHILRRE